MVTREHAIRTLRGDVDERSGRVGEQAQAALALLYTRYFATVLSAARRYAHAEADAEDLAQDVFLKLPRAVQRYEPGNFEGWLRCLVVRAAVSRYRREARQECLGDADVASMLESRTDLEVPTAALEQAIDALERPLAAVVRLRFFSDLSHIEIAASLGISPGTSAVRLCRALKRLRLLLEAAVMKRHDRAIETVNQISRQEAICRL